MQVSEALWGSLSVAAAGGPHNSNSCRLQLHKTRIIPVGQIDLFAIKGTRLNPEKYPKMRLQKETKMHHPRMAYFWSFRVVVASDTTAVASISHPPKLSHVTANSF